MAEPRSRAIRQLEDRMAQLQPGTLRYDALEAAKRFKGSWITLGQMLWTVWKEKAFRDWGYLTFEAYSAKEVGIRAATAKKLLYSYAFLEREEPDLLRRVTAEAPAALPHYDAVNVLRLLKQRPGVPEGPYRTIRAQVLEQGREAPAVRREVRTLLEATAEDPEAARAAHRQAAIRRMIGTMKALRVELEAAKLVPQTLVREVETLIQRLEAHLS